LIERLRFLYADNVIGISHFEYNEDFGFISNNLQNLQQQFRSHICKGDMTPNNPVRTNAFEHMKDNKLQSMDSLTKSHETVFDITDFSIGGFDFMNF